MLGDSVSVYLDGGPTPPGIVPSSIVDVTGKVPVLLRAGALSAEELRKVVPDSRWPIDRPPRGAWHSGGSPTLSASSTSAPATSAARRSPSG